MQAKSIGTPLQSGDRVPHFTVASLDGSRASYSDLWQRENLLLLLLPGQPSGPESAYVAALRAREADWTSFDTACVITRDDLPGAPRPGVVIADRWGEIHLVQDARAVAELPPVDHLVEWLRYIAHKCPECEGEAR
jgi:hypothetical protein